MGGSLCGVKTVKRYVNVHLHCIVGSLKRTSKTSTLPTPGKISADAHACVYISVRQGDAVASPMLENWPLFGQNFLRCGQIIQLHSHLTEAVSVLPQFMFVSNKDVSPNIPLGNKNYPKYSEITLSGVLANVIKIFLVLGTFHAIPHLIWAKVIVSTLDFGVFFQVNYPNSKK